MSLAFQGDEIDIVSSVVHVQTRNEQLEPLQRRDLQDLQTWKHFLQKVQENDEQLKYQNVTLPSFNAAKESAEHKNCVARLN